ncbi:vWA domain-containing protein [Thiobacter aerophilum]|uniref:VWA-like domain-containing protein n=1 Tax=Thiobacter aerophilum TaxID=3121275 RepID=A0ABV0ECV9_9BURK
MSSPLPEVPDLEALKTKLSAARTRLILEKPFLGALVMHLELKAVDPALCRSTGTDARHFYYNPSFIRHLTLAQTQFMLAHEAMHCALAHFARRHHRERKRWDVACDHAVNLILWEEGLQPPPGVLMNPEYHGLTAEEIYPLIPPDPDEETIDSHLYDSESSSGSQSRPDQQSSADRGDSQQDAGRGAGQGNLDEPPPDSLQGESPGQAAKQQQGLGSQREIEGLTETEKEELGRQWQQRLAAAAQQAAMAGKLSKTLARMVDNLLQPQLPWRMLLARYLKTAARDDYSFQKPSRREGDAIMPSLASSMIDVVVVLDTSGSIDDEELREFLSEVDVIKAQIRARVTLHACDDRLCENGPWLYEVWEPLTLPRDLTGGGGTDFRPVFQWLNSQGIRPDVLVYFTDAEGEFPPLEPAYPVIWLVKGKAPVPWGQRIQLN